MIFFINSKKDGIQKVLVDKEDAHIFFDKKISIYKDSHTNTYYAGTKKGRVHRLCMNAKGKIFVDHINHNTLDNRKENLRLVNNSLNAKNASVRKDNNTGVRGVTFVEKENKYVCFWVDKYGIRHKKTFSANKYGKNEAFKMAVETRLKMEKDNDYL